MGRKQKLELTWIGKNDRPRIEPRILLANDELSYHSQSASEAVVENMVVQGDNLIALKALESSCSGKVKCIYADPPYNTGSAFDFYDDGVEHSVWLSLMRERLNISKTLLRPDGSIWISIDDNEYAYLRVLCDEIFGRNNFVTTIIWEKRKSRENRRVFSFKHDYILVYAKERRLFDAVRNLVPLNAEVLSRYKNPDNDPRGPWQSVSANAQAGHATKSQFYVLQTPGGRAIEPPPGRCWLYTKSKMEAEIAAGNIWFGRDGNGAPRVKKFLRQSEDAGLTPETIWYADEVSTNDEAKKHSNVLFDGNGFESPKPEALLLRILEIATDPNDLVLDSFAGSGTTGAVAQKMGRRWIMVELGDHAQTHIVSRLKKVLDGSDMGGVTEQLSWKGGGAFRFYNLAPSLLERDRWGNWIISKMYNPAMLAEAMCKHMAFTYAPSQNPLEYWNHGFSSERDFVYVTTQALTHSMLKGLSHDVGPERHLLICCKAFSGKTAEFANLSVRRIPQAVLANCEWGRDDYSLRIANLSQREVADNNLAPEETSLPKRARHRLATETAPDLFSEPAETEA